MKRFITLTVAVLLGLVSSQDVPDSKPETHNQTELRTQSDFIAKSKDFEMKWDQVTLAANAASC